MHALFAHFSAVSSEAVSAQQLANHCPADQSREIVFKLILPEAELPYNKFDSNYALIKQTKTKKPR